MKEAVEKYIHDISSKFIHETTSEYGYRTPFEILLKEIFAELDVRDIGHDDKTRGGNKPDFVIRKNDVPLLYIEVKDFGISLDKIEQSEQMARYFGYDNLVLSDYAEFRFYRLGVPYGEPIKIADYDIKKRTISPKTENYEYLAKTLLDFTQSHKEPIKSGNHLAKIMGGKAQRIRDNVRQFLASQSDGSAELVKVYETIKKTLVHDLSEKDFSDMYAQTLVYGLFVARYYDETSDNFSRQEARDLIPASNPLLRHFFDHIIGPDFDKRLEYIVDELCEVFAHADVEKLMKDYFQGGLWGDEQKGPDPVIHFYEDFLQEYDPELRKDMGAYYTPRPVVMFIAKSVDYLLKDKFNLSGGLADTTRVVNDLHKVQVLDPAVGTGTFISAVIRMIYASLLKSGQKGRWPKYVHNELLPRIHGFELMMAPYTIAHLKLAMAFRETGFKYFNRRLGVYLTNSLEEASKQEELFAAFGLAESIAEESKEAEVIKNTTPVMVVIGNPPYKGESNNKFYEGHGVYKVEPTGGKLQERNSKWLNDDYVKFIRFAESMVERTGYGIVAMITAHGYIDNPTFRGMRWHLMNTFDEIYVLDLHGNTNKKEKSPDGSIDKNVFDIKTGVSILFGVKREKTKQEPATIYKADLYGKRAAKFDFLNKKSIRTVDWEKVTPVAPNYVWIARDEKVREEYLKGFSVSELFPVSSVGIVTSRDAFVIDEDKEKLVTRIQEFSQCETIQEAKSKFNLRENKKWKIADALKHEFDEKNIVPISYRPFDKRYVYYHEDFIERSRIEVMKHLLNNSYGIISTRQVKAGESYQHLLASKGIVESTYVSNKTSEIGYVFPLFLQVDDITKTPNLRAEIVEKIEEGVGKASPEDIFDYIYAVLHSPKYRKKYKEFLKIDFPRIPYPKDKETFKELVKLGRELRELHLLESPKVNKFITTYPVAGSDTVEKKPEYKDGRVYINSEQYFGNVPEVAWNFWIGGYQPAQKWLKDRKDRVLTNEDIEHYQKMVVALVETEKTMKEIDQTSI